MRKLLYAVAGVFTAMVLLTFVVMEFRLSGVEAFLVGVVLGILCTNVALAVEATIF